MKDRNRSARHLARAPRLRAFLVREVEADDDSFYDLELVFAKSASGALALLPPHRFYNQIRGEGVVVERVPGADRFADRPRVASRRRDALAQRAAGFMWDEGSSPCESCELHPTDAGLSEVDELTAVCSGCDSCGECGHADDCPEARS